MHMYSYRNGELMNEYKCSPVSAMNRIFQYELGFGGCIRALTEKEVVVETPIFSHLDRTVVSFSEGDYDKVFPAFQFWNSSCSGIDDLYTKVKGVLGESAGNPLMLRMSTGMIMGGVLGGNRPRLVTAMSFAFTPFIGEKDAVILSMWLFRKGKTPDEETFLSTAHREVLSVVPDMSLEEAMDCTNCLDYYQEYENKITEMTGG